MSELESSVYNLAGTLFPPHVVGALRQEVIGIKDAAIKERILHTLALDLMSAGQGGSLSFTNFKKTSEYLFEPVGVEEFLLDDFYLGLRGDVYPKIMEEMIEMNSGKYVEAVLTGAIGTAKTTMALWSTAYQVYLLSALRHPQKKYGLDRSSEILFVFQSLNHKKAKDLNFGRFRELIHKSPYFKEEFPFDHSLESELIFPNRIIVRPITGLSTGAIGENVIGGIIDELNFMSMVENSRQADESGGVYDQAVTNYNALASRRKSRFMKRGELAGMLCLVSSKKYPNQFTDRKQEEAKTDPTIYVYDKRTWDIKPEGTYSGDRFNLFIGDLTRQARILNNDDPEIHTDPDLVMTIPVEHRTEFELDMVHALRDVAGVSTLASNPYFGRVELVSGSFGQVESILSDTTCNFANTTVEVLPHLFRDLHRPRYVHIDLGLTADSAGISCGYCSGFTEVGEGDDVEVLPIIELDFILRVTPPLNDEINFEKIRKILYVCIDLGLPIRWASLDSFQSRDTMQILRQKGIATGLLSMDTSPLPYSILKTAMYQGRVKAPQHDFCMKEIQSLEFNLKKGKVDHLSNTTKDCSDALAGVVYGLTMRRETWADHGISSYQIPQSLQTIIISRESKMKQ